MSDQPFFLLQRNMTALLSAWLPKPLKALAVRFENEPIDSVERLTEFSRTRASYVAQTSLYGYLKTRMGTRFTEYFEDDVFSKSIRIAAANLFVSCLGDLTIFCVAVAGGDRRLDESDAAALARHCFAAGMDRTLADLDPQVIPADAVENFIDRSAATHWANATQGTTAFGGSQRDIVRFAPVVDEFKALDREIVENSIRYRWRDVREQLRKRIAPEQVCLDWRRVSAEAASAEP